MTTTEAELGPVATGEKAVSWLHQMMLIRTFETEADALSLRGKIPGGIHPAIGQEAVAVGVVSALAPDDVLTSTHRSHHHALAKGLSPVGVMAELYGTSDGVAGGRGGSMHLADFDKGLWGSNGIVGGGLGIALGAAMGSAQLKLGRVAVGFFGDGGANTGRTWEFINLATVWRLPLIAICENNLYAVETPSASVTGGGNVAARAAGFGLPSEQVDGQDIEAVHRATARAVQRARAGEGPTFLELLTYRYKGHNAGEVITYRTEDEVEEQKRTRDPIERYARRLIDRGDLDEARRAQLQEDVDAVVADAVARSEAGTCSDPSTAAENVSVWNSWKGGQAR